MTDSKRSAVGSPQRAEIDRFIASLSPWDLLYIRHRLRYTKIELAGLDDIPEEVVCMLIPHLTIEDFLACRLVSRGWAVAWSRDLVVAQMCRRFFPGVMETCPPEAPRGVLFRAINTQGHQYRSIYFKRDAIHWNGNWDSPDFLNMAPRPQSIPASTGSRRRATAELQHPIRYADGKIGWQPRHDLILIDDLNVRARQRVICPRLEAPFRCQLGGLSNQLVTIFGVNDRQTSNAVHVYHLQDGQFKTIHLPNPVARCFVHGDRVGLVTRTGQIIMWSWNGKATQLNLEGLDSPPGTLQHLVPGVLFHPTEPGVVFVVRCHSHRHICKFHTQSTNLLVSRLWTFEVVKFEDARRTWHSTASVLNPTGTRRTLINTTWIQLYFSLQKADKHGSFTLAVYRVQNQLDTPETEGLAEPWKSGDWGAISFNVITQTFTKNYYDWHGGKLLWNPTDESDLRRIGPGPHNLLENLHIWNNRLVLTWSHQLSRDEKLKLYMLVMNPVGSGTSLAMRNPVNIDDQSSGFVGPVFQDDNSILVPTKRRLWLLEPVEEQPEDGEWDFLIQGNDEPLPKYFQAKSHLAIGC